jgi:hypothetical protein
MILNDVEERFLRTVAERVAPDRVEMVYLFPSLRQGPIDSGVAVVAEAMLHEADQPTDGVDRYTVHTATYRHTVKGRERGGWIVEVAAQADAPLEVVAAVVQGVQRRSAAITDPKTLSGAEFRSIVGPMAPAGSASPSAAMASSSGGAT